MPSEIELRSILDRHRLPLGVPALLEELTSQGITVQQLFAHANLPLKAEGPLRYGRKDLRAIIGAAKELSVNPETAMAAGLRQKISHFGVFGYALITSNTFGQAFQFGLDHFDLTGAVIEVNFVRKGSLGILRTQNPMMLGKNLQFVAEFWRSSMTMLLSEVLGRPFPSVEMFFPFKKPPYHDLYRQTFNCKLNFRTEKMEWHFDASVLDDPCPNADPMTTEVCQDICDQMAVERGESRLKRSIRGICITRSNRAAANAESVADLLGISIRTLHRRLAEEGTTFKQLLDETRFSIASEYLKNTAVTIEEISARCGYGDVSNFRKAFHRWAGVSPTIYRRS